MKLIEGVHYLNNHPANIPFANAINQYEEYFDTHASAEEKQARETTIKLFNLQYPKLDNYSLIYTTRELNFKLNLWEQYYKKTTLLSFPIFVQFPVDTQCNLHCVFCYYHEIREKLGDITLEDFKKMSYFLDFVWRVGLSGAGEPLFNPPFEEIWDYIVSKHPGININVCTNGTLLNDHWIDKIIEYNNCAINISLNAGTRETYKKVMGGDYFYKVIENIYALRSAMSLINPCNIKLSISIVVIKENLNEVSRFIDVAKELDVDIEIKKVYGKTEKLFATDTEKTESVLTEASKKLYGVKTNVKSIPPNFFKDLKQDRKAVCDDEPILDKKLIDVPGRPSEKGICRYPWISLYLTNFANAAPCLFFSRPINDIREQTFQEIWNGEDFIKLRETVNTNNLLPECQNCLLQKKKNCINVI